MITFQGKVNQDAYLDTESNSLSDKIVFDLLVSKSFIDADINIKESVSLQPIVIFKTKNETDKRTMEKFKKGAELELTGNMVLNALHIKASLDDNQATIKFL